MVSGGGGFLPLIEMKDCKRAKSLKSEDGTLWNVSSEKGLENSHILKTVRMTIVYKYETGGGGVAEKNVMLGCRGVFFQLCRVCLLIRHQQPA